MNLSLQNVDILFVNTSIQDFFVAHYDAKSLDFEYFDYMQQAEKIADISKSFIKQFRNKHRILVVNNGVGSLTGTRIGCAFASGISNIFDKVYTVNSFMPFLQQAQQLGFNKVAISGKKHTVYVLNVNSKLLDFKEIRIENMESDTFLAPKFSADKFAEFFLDSFNELKPVEYIEAIYPVSF